MSTGQNSITIDLRVKPGVVTLVNVNGTLVTEVTVGKADGRDNLLAEVRSARALRSVPDILRSALTELERAERLPDHVNRPEKRRDRFTQGLLDGWAERIVEYPHRDPDDLRGEIHATQPRQIPAFDPSYEAGYWKGEALARACRLSKPQDLPEQAS